VSKNQERPPRWLWRGALIVAVVTMASILVWQAIGAVSSLLMLLLVALFVALAIEPPVNFLVGKGWRRGAATGVVMGVVGMAIIGAMAAFGQMFVTQVIELVQRIPSVYADVADWLNDRFNLDLPDQNNALRSLAASWGDDLASQAWAAGTAAFSGLISLLGLVLIVYYLSARGPQFRAAICSPLPAKRQRQVLHMWSVAQEKIAGYISSRVVLAIINALATTVLLMILKVPFALPLSLFCGVVSQFVPTVGTYIGGAGPVLFALVVSPVRGAIVLVFIIAYQQVENLWLSPKITSKAMEINPAVAFVSVIALGSIMGPIGAFLSLPMVATAQAVISTYIRRYDLVDDALLTQDSPRGPKDSPGGSGEAGGSAQDLPVEGAKVLGAKTPKEAPKEA
jgi:predicted PurR-regulated permease PerM